MGGVVRRVAGHQDSVVTAEARGRIVIGPESDGFAKSTPCRWEDAPKSGRTARVPVLKPAEAGKSDDPAHFGGGIPLFEFRGPEHRFRRRPASTWEETGGLAG